MPERSPFTNVLLVALVVVVALGFYFLVDALDVFRLRVEDGFTEIGAVRSELARLRGAVERGGLAAARAPQVGDAGRAEDEEAPWFANMDLRDPDAEDGGSIVLATSSETGNLNNIINNDSIVASFWGLCNDSLAARNMKEPTRFEPQLARKWEISEDRLTYTIHLRPGVYWHDFTDPTTNERFTEVELTADDFKFFIEVVQNPLVACEPLRNYYEDLEEIRVLDRYTFQVVWREPYFLSESLTLGLIPLPRHFYQFDPENADKEFNENVERNRMIVGTGPWRFSRWDRGSEIVFVRNEDYYGPKPHLREMRYRLIKEPSAQLLALRRGEVDRIGLTAEQWLDQTGDEAFQERFNRFRYSRRVYFYIGYNMRSTPFDDPRVRLAMTHMIDRQRILDDVYRGLGRQVTGPFFIETPYYDHSIEPHPFDLGKARELLAEAGWRDTTGDSILNKDGERFEFTFLLISNHPYFTRMAAIIKEDMAKVGVVMNILELEWSVYTERLNARNFDVCALGWSLPFESDPYQVWHSSEADVVGSSNHVGFANEEADRIIETARREFDLDKRVELYQRFHRILHEEQPYTFLLSPDSLVVQHRRYRNAVVYPLGMDINLFWVPKAEQKPGE